MKKMWMIACAVLLACTSCDKQVVLKELSLQEKMNSKVAELTALSELGTVEYKVTKVVKASDDAKWYQFGDRKILFQCTAYLKAGIDLNDFDPSKIKIDEAKKSAIVVLPKAKLLSFNMPADEAKLAYEKVSLTRFKFTAQERNLLLRQGEEDIRKDVPNMGILQDAEKNASSFFKSLLSQMGFESVTVKFV